MKKKVAPVKHPTTVKPNKPVDTKAALKAAKKKAVKKKAAPKQVAPKKTPSIKAAPKLTPSKKVAPKKVAPKKAAPKKAAMGFAPREAEVEARTALVSSGSNVKENSTMRGFGDGANSGFKDGQLVMVKGTTKKGWVVINGEPPVQVRLDNGLTKQFSDNQLAPI